LPIGYGTNSSRMAAAVANSPAFAAGELHDLQP